MFVRDPAYRMRFYYHLYRRDITNLSFLRHRKFTGFIVSMHQAGTHWLKHMLASAIARNQGLPPPKYAYAGEMIGGPRDPVSYPGIPLFGHSHTIPSPLIRNKLLRHLIGLPRYVILVRDIRSMLVSHYDKYRHEYQCTFDEYLRGDVSNKRFVCDIWWCIRFQNAWGRVMELFPQEFLLVRYEDMAADATKELGRINEFLGLNLSAAEREYGIRESTREKMQQKPLKSSEKIGKLPARKVVRDGGRDEDHYYTPANDEYLRDICANYLGYDFGYDYNRRPGRLQGGQ